MQRIPKLIPGKRNIPYIKVKAGAAHGARRPTKLKNRPEAQVIQFNAPILVVKLLKVS